MATHRYRPSRYYNVIGTAEPCLRIADGDTVITDTLDASGLDAHEVPAGQRPNPMSSDHHGSRAGAQFDARVRKSGPPSTPDKRSRIVEAAVPT